MQGHSGDIDIEKRLVDTVREGEEGTNSEEHGNIHLTIHKIDSHWDHAICHREVNLSDNLEGRDGVGDSFPILVEILFLFLSQPFPVGLRTKKNSKFLQLFRSKE